MQVKIVGNDHAGYRIVKAIDNSVTLGFAANYSGCLLIVSRQGWVVG